MKEIVKELIYINESDNDYCVVDNLIQDWKKMLSEYMTTHYIKLNKYEAHHFYFIAIEDTDEDTINVFNKSKIPIYSIDKIAHFSAIKFLDEESRDLVFNVLNVW